MEFERQKMLKEMRAVEQEVVVMRAVEQEVIVSEVIVRHERKKAGNNCRCRCIIL